jgi:hypothetical protein
MKQGMCAGARGSPDSSHGRPCPGKLFGLRTACINAVGVAFAPYLPFTIM